MSNINYSPEFNKNLKMKHKNKFKKAHKDKFKKNKSNGLFKNIDRLIMHLTSLFAPTIYVDLSRSVKDAYPIKRLFDANSNYAASMSARFNEDIYITPEHQDFSIQTIMPKLLK